MVTFRVAADNFSLIAGITSSVLPWSFVKRTVPAALLVLRLFVVAQRGVVSTKGYCTHTCMPILPLKLLFEAGRCYGRTIATINATLVMGACFGPPWFLPYVRVPILEEVLARRPYYISRRNGRSRRSKYVVNVFLPQGPSTTHRNTRSSLAHLPLLVSSGLIADDCIRSPSALRLGLSVGVERNVDKKEDAHASPKY